jgi:hypothetical protein
LAGPANYPKLTKANYNQWALLMWIKLKARGLWGAAETGARGLWGAAETGDAEFQVD